MKLSSKIFAGLLTGIAAFGLASTASAADISGAGATFPFPIYAKWAAVYKGQTGTGLNYQSIGSGGGIKQIESKTVTFGASDIPLSVAELNKYGMLQFPAVIGGIVPVVNLAGITTNQLVLDGPTLANIFLGNIANWSDPAIKKLNPGVNLPNQAIAVVHRADGSGTTFNFTDYLSKVSPEWKSRVGEATAVDWPVGIGAKGNEFVASNVAGTKGSIGYVEFAYAKQNNLTYTKMINKDGKTVMLSVPAMQAAAAGAKWDPAQGFGTVITDQPGADSWPITAATFILVYKKPVDAAATTEALKFFKWGYGADGDKLALALDYVALPDSLTNMVQTSWKDIQGVTP